MEAPPAGLPDLFTVTSTRYQRSSLPDSSASRVTFLPNVTSVSLRREFPDASTRVGHQKSIVVFWMSRTVFWYDTTTGLIVESNILRRAVSWHETYPPFPFRLLLRMVACPVPMHSISPTSEESMEMSAPSLA